MVEWDVTSAAVQGVVGSGHMLFFFYSAEYIVDVLTHVKVLGLLLMYILNKFWKADTALLLVFKAVFFRWGILIIFLIKQQCSECGWAENLYSLFLLCEWSSVQL